MKRLFPRATGVERYPARVFLCAYMLLAHPEVVFNRQGEREEALTAAASELVTATEALLYRLVVPASALTRFASN